MSEWIAFKDRNPTESDFPIIVADYDAKNGGITWVTPLEPWDVWTHFRPPEPPKPRVILRHHDGREEEILEPVYALLRENEDAEIVRRLN